MNVRFITLHGGCKIRPAMLPVATLTSSYENNCSIDGKTIRLYFDTNNLLNSVSFIDS